jgi:hypothetical protein
MSARYSVVVKGAARPLVIDTISRVRTMNAEAGGPTLPPRTRATIEALSPPASPEPLPAKKPCGCGCKGC